MKDEYDVNGGDKIVVGRKMKTVCETIALGNPVKTPVVDVLFNHDSILKRLNLYNAYRVIPGRVKHGPGKGRLVARVLLEDVIGRKPGMYRKKVS